VKIPTSGPIDLKGKVALVSGAAGGIGLEICRSLAREGADVACLDLAEPAEAVKLVKEQGRKALGIQAEVCQEEAVRQAMAQVKDGLGGLDILICSHGILGDCQKPLTEISGDEWDQVMAVNLKGTFLLLKEAWPLMADNGGGKMVFLGSLAGRVGGLLASAAYSTSKGGLHTLVKWAARRGASQGILANGIAPGPVVTPMIKGEAFTDDMIPLGRLGQPQDIAEACVFLASQASNWITGHTLDINGGAYMN
jgi:3-oxoacyl-[acyl-carrier protein] reductase